MDKSGSEYVLCTYPTPSRTSWALYLSRAESDTKKKYIPLFSWFYNFQYSQEVHFMFPIFNLVQSGAGVDVTGGYGSGAVVPG